MKITLTNKEAKTLFCQKAAPDRTGIIFEALDGQARTMTINRATGTALETKINTSRIAEKGTAILPDVTSEIVALAPDKDMTIETNEDKASITFEGGAYTLPTMLKPQDKDPLETIPAEEMEYGLIQGPFFARTLTGAMRIITSVPGNIGPSSFALIDILPGRADFVATNRKLLACWSVKDDTGTNHITGTGRILIAKNAIPTLRAMTRDEPVRIAEGGGRIIVSTRPDKDTTVTATLPKINGRFPAWEKIFPAETRTTISADSAKNVLSTLRVASSANKGHEGIKMVKLTVGESSVTFEAKPLYGDKASGYSSTQTLGCRVTASPDADKAACFPQDVLDDALTTLGAGKCTIGMNAHDNPFTIHDEPETNNGQSLTTREAFMPMPQAQAPTRTA